MKKFFLLLIIISYYSTAATGQNLINTITITVPANPPANTADWANGIPPVMIMAQAKLENGKIPAAVSECKILVTIKSGGAKICGKNSPQTAPGAGFNTATKIWTGGVVTNLLGQDCVLKPGSYELCVQFYGESMASANTILGETCKPFTIQDNKTDNFSPPQNIYPNPDQLFTKTQTNIPLPFRWTPVVPKPSGIITYRLRVWQLLQGQTASQAITANQPIAMNDIKGMTQTTEINNYIADPCILPNTCEFVWTVQALDEQLKPVGSNNGTSEPTTFKTSNTPTTGARVGAVPCSTTSVKSYHTGDIISLSNNFQLKLTEEPTGNNDALIGKGTVDVKWIGVLNVQFNGIKINCDDKLDTGAVYTVTDSKQEYPTQWGINVLNHTGIPNWTTNKIKELAAGIDSNKLTKPLIEAADNITTPASAPLNMPLGYFKTGDDSYGSLGFTEMVFKPTKAEFEVIAALRTSKVFKQPASGPFINTDAIALQGKGIEFTDEGLKKINGEIKLVEPLIFTYTTGAGEQLKITFNKDEPGHIGNGIVFRDTSSAYWRYNIDASVELPSNWLQPVDQTKTNVDVNFQTLINKWDNFIISTTIPACTIPNTNGLGFEETTIIYDHSNTENHPDIEFPENYGVQESSEMFSGFYIPSFNMTLPDGLRSYADTTKLIHVGAENLIINKDGITGKIFAHNVLSYPLANVGNLAASIDTVNIELFKKVLTSANMTGKITLPMSSKDDVASTISYNALFIPASATDDGTRSLTFTLNPDQDIKSKFLGSGKIKVDQTSNLSLLITRNAAKEREIKLDIDVNGSLYYPGGAIANPVNPSKPFELNLDCKFEHMKMSYDNKADESFSFKTGNWSFASPQKKLAGFAFTISDVKPILGPFSLSGQYLAKCGLEFVAKINIGSENSKIAISGDVKVQLLAGIKSSNFNAGGVDTTGTKKKFGFLSNLKPEFLGVRVSNVNVDVHMAAADIKGSVAFYKEDPVYGTGFRGDIAAKFKTVELTIQASALFGNTKYIPGNTATPFKYWMVQAQVVLPPPGIVFMTGIAFRGAGIGLYSRMKMTSPATFNPTVANSSTFGGAVFTPDNTVSIGFKIKAIIATTPKEETFNGSVALSGEFNTSGGMNFIQIDGLFNCGAKIASPADAFANGAITVKYDFPNKIFSLNSALILDVRSKGIDIYTPSPITTVLYIDGKKNKWYFKSGVPTNPMTVYAYGINAQSYLMFGNDLGSDIPTNYMQATRDGWASVGLGPLSFSDKATAEGKYKTAKGFAFGAALNFSKTDALNIDGPRDGRCNITVKNPLGDAVTRYLNIYYNVAAGGELDASLLQYSGCKGFNNGWRAKVSSAIYAGVSVTYDYNEPGGGCYSHQGTLIDIAAGAAATVEFPNTTYFKGTINGHWNLCGYSRSFSKEIEKGTQCGGSEIQLDPSINENVYKQENAADSLKKKLITGIVTPSASTDVYRKTYFSTLLDYPYNEPFDVQEQQSSGQMNVRTFRVLYTASLTQDSASATTGGGIATSLSAAAMVPISSSSATAASTGTTAGTAISGVVKSTAGVKSTVKTAAPGSATLSATAFKEAILLEDAGYDELGAKRFRLQGSSGLSSTVALKINSSYKFLVTGALQENIGGVWKAVNYKNTTVAITQNKYFYFKTNSEPVGIPSASSSTIAPKF